MDDGVPASCRTLRRHALPPNTVLMARTLLSLILVIAVDELHRWARHAAYDFGQSFPFDSLSGTPLGGLALGEFVSQQTLPDGHPES